MSKLLSKALVVSLALYVVSLQTSMAGMEIFGWLSGILGLALFISKARSSGGVGSAFRKFLIPAVDHPVLSLFVVIVLGVLIAAPPEADKVFAIGSARWIFMFLLLRMAMSNFEFRNAEGFLRLGVVVAAVVGAYCIFQHFAGIDLIRGAPNTYAIFLRDDGSPYYRVEGFFTLPTTFAHNYAQWACLPFAYFLVRSRQKISALSGFALFSAILACVAILFSLTRGTWISFPIAFVVMVGLSRKDWIPKIFIAVAAFLAVMYFAAPEVLQRSATILDTSASNESNSSRMDLWKANVAIFRDYPVLGVGYGVNELVTTDYLRNVGAKAKGGNAHNTYLQFLSGTGLVGLLLFLAFIGFLFIYSLRLYRGTSDQDLVSKTIILAAIGAQIATHVGGITDCNFKDGEVNHTFIFAIACIAMLWGAQRQEQYPIGVRS